MSRRRLEGGAVVVTALGLPRQKWEVDTWARDFGQARELGGYRRAYKAARRRHRADWIFLYAGGMAQVVDGDAGPRVVPWDLLGQVLKEYSYGTADTDPSLQTIRVVGRDGTEITAGANEYRWIGQLERDIDTVVTERRFPAALEQYRSGAPVLFGSLSVSVDSIAWANGAKRAAWAAIRSVNVTDYEVELVTKAPRQRHHVALGGIPDSRVAVMLIQEAAARLGIAQGSSARALSPPGRPRIAVAQTALLSETEVSEVFGWPMEAVAGPAAGGRAARFQDGGAVLSLAVRNRSALDAVITRRLGQAVPEIGDGAWLLNGDRTLVVLADPVTVKLDLEGLPRSARAAVLIPLGRTVAVRLAAQPGEAGGP